MLIESNKNLAQYNTFRINVNARAFADITSVDNLLEVLKSEEAKTLPLFILGGGSNMLLSRDVEALVLHMNIQGIEVCEEGDHVYVRAGAGVAWNDLVQFCVKEGYAGLENLTLIPGSVGASPIQNIGAYGVEMKDTFFHLEAVEIATKHQRKFNKSQCQFGYRESIFKSELAGQYIITAVTFALSKTPNLKLQYGAIFDELQKRGIAEPNIKDVSEVVAAIRVSKLPDPSTIGNSGSFFKNPIIPKSQLQQLLSDFPTIVHYPVDSTTVKLAAGWLIEQCGWKGKRSGDVGTWPQQALVIVNHGNASGDEILKFSEEIIQSVQAKFQVKLEREVNLY
jgi:UDP-N-acetylmuramate dehydrogenase